MKYKIAPETLLTLRCILGDAQQFLKLLEDLYKQSNSTMSAESVREKIKQIEYVKQEIEYSALDKDWNS